jgi:hypothetical protein
MHKTDAPEARDANLKETRSWSFYEKLRFVLQTLKKLGCDNDF